MRKKESPHAALDRLPPPTLVSPVEAVVMLLVVGMALFLLAEGRERVRLMEKGEVVKVELAAIDRAIAIRKAEQGGLPDGDLAFHEYSAHLPVESGLRTGRDYLGSRPGPQPASGSVRVPRSSWGKLKYVVDDSFWDPWQVPVSPLRKEWRVVDP